MRTAPAPEPAHEREQRSVDVIILATLSGSIAILHVSAAVGHINESLLYGLGFIGLALAQATWSASLLATAGGRRVLTAGLLLNLAVVAVWALSRTVGLPLGPDLGHPESAGIPDLIATFDELLLIALGARRLARERPLPEGLRRLAAACIFLTLLCFVSFSHVS
jgi:hypothetical protein